MKIIFNKTDVKMKIRYFSICLVFTSVFLFTSCEVNEPTDNNSQFATENKVSVFVENGSLNSPGDIRIVNESDQKIFIPYVLYPYCSFSIYQLQKNNGTNLTYDEFENRWEESPEVDSIVTVCQEYRNPIMLNPSQSFSKSISNISQTGEYQIKIFYRYSEVHNSNTKQNEITINYYVK